jgi:hypothetical protein
MIMTPNPSLRKAPRRARTLMVKMMRTTRSLPRVARRAVRAVLLPVDNSRSASNNEN